MGLGGVDFFSPEALTMLFMAAMIDLLGFMLVMFFLDDFGILDVVGMLLIGSWMFLRFGSFKKPKKGSVVGGKIKRWMIATIVELIPILGSFCPTWTIAVYYELKNG